MSDDVRLGKSAPRELVERAVERARMILESGAHPLAIDPQAVIREPDALRYRHCQLVLAGRRDPDERELQRRRAAVDAEDDRRLRVHGEDQAQSRISGMSSISSSTYARCFRSIAWHSSISASARAGFLRARFSASIAR